MIELARLVDPAARAVRKIVQTEEEGDRGRPTRKIAEARFAIEGPNHLPGRHLQRSAWLSASSKATSRKVSIFRFETTFAGLYQRAADHNRRGSFRFAPALECR